MEITLTPQETAWKTPLDEDEEHATFDTAHVDTYFAAATRAEQVLAALRAPYRGRSTPVNAWWGSFDLSVSLFSGRPAEPPSKDFIMRNSMDAEEVAVGWWPGDPRYPRAAFYAYAHPAPEGFKNAKLTPAAARWDESLGGEFVLDWDDVRSAARIRMRLRSTSPARSFCTRARCAVGIPRCPTASKELRRRSSSGRVPRLRSTRP